VLEGRQWVRAITRELSVPAVKEYLRLWDIMENVVLSDRPDMTVWRWTPNGIYSAKSAYNMLHSRNQIQRTCLDLENLGATKGKNLPMAGLQAQALDGRLTHKAWIGIKRILLPL
jgi:hypothetical protein